MLETGLGEISMYYSEFYRSGGGVIRFRRCTLRTDGFRVGPRPLRRLGRVHAAANDLLRFRA